MTGNLQLTFLKTKVSHEIEQFERRVESNRKWAVRLRLATVTIGVLTTILIGIIKYVSVSWVTPDHMIASAFVLSSFVPLVSAIESIYEPRRMWIVYNGTVVALYGLSDELEFETLGNEIQPARLKAFFDRFESILGDANANWQKQRLSSVERDAENDAQSGARGEVHSASSTERVVE